MAGKDVGVPVAAEGRRLVVEMAGEPQQVKSQLRRLAQAALDITRADTVDDVLHLTTEAAREIIGCHQGVCSRLVHGWTHATTRVSLSDKYAAWRDYDEPPKGLGVLNAVTRENRPLRLDSEQLLEHPEFRGLRDAPGHPPLPDYLAAPLIGRNGVNLGLVQLSDRFDGRPFSPEDESMLVQLAQLASAAIERLEAAGAAAREAALAQALAHVGRAIASRLELEEIVQLATDAATELVGARFGAFFYNVDDTQGERLTLYTISGVPREAFEGFPMPRPTAIFSPTFRGEEVVRIDDVLADPRYGKAGPHYGMPPGHLPVRSYLAAPVVTDDGEVAGGLFFGHPEIGRFTEEHERIAVGIADQAAVGLVNARLYAAAQFELRAREAALRERDLVARTLQESLLPPTLPEVEGLDVAARYRPGSAAVGGDFYDLFPLGEDVWGLVIGDVCGRGTEAAARTALTRHTLRTAAMLQSSPSAVLRVLNEALVRHSRDRFATAAYGRLRRTNGSFGLRFSSGGHPPFALLRADGRVELVETEGMLLGVVDQVTVADHTISLEPGDVLVLYTDGLIEGRSGGEAFGEDRLRTALATCTGKDAHAIADCLIETSDDFASVDDDTAVLVVRVT